MGASRTYLCLLNRVDDTSSGGHVRQPITGQNGLSMAGPWPAVTRQFQAAERPPKLAIKQGASY